MSGTDISVLYRELTDALTSPRQECVGPPPWPARKGARGGQEAS